MSNSSLWPVCYRVSGDFSIKIIFNFLVCGVCNDGSIQMWDHRKNFVNVCLQVETAHTFGSEITGVAFAYDNRMLATRSNDESLKLWDLRWAHVNVDGQWDMRWWSANYLTFQTSNAIALPALSFKLDWWPILESKNCTLQFLLEFLKRSAVIAINSKSGSVLVHKVVFGSVKEPKESLCLSVRPSVCPAPSALKHWIFIFLS